MKQERASVPPNTQAASEMLFDIPPHTVKQEGATKPPGLGMPTSAQIKREEQHVNQSNLIKSDSYSPATLIQQSATPPPPLNLDGSGSGSGSPIDARDRKQEIMTPPPSTKSESPESDKIWQFTAHNTTARYLEEANILKTFLPAKRRLFLFDYDGTLTEIVPDPGRAILPDELVRNIGILADDPRNTVYIISGRDQMFLKERFGHLSKLGLCGEHGAFLRRPGNAKWEDLARSDDMTWQSEVMKIFEHYVELAPGSNVERKRVAIVWHYRLVDQYMAEVYVAEIKNLLKKSVAKKWAVEIVNGKCVIEVRPKLVNKGQVAQRLVDEIRSSTGEPPDFTICIGDDLTDEGREVAF